MITDQKMIDAYDKHKHLKIAANELGIKWQLYYIKLKKLGVQVVGDKSKYGSDSDKLACKGEALFKSLVPFAKDQNETQFQAKVDFMVGGYSVDVKTSTVKQVGKNGTGRFAFSLKKQELIADFFVCFGMTKYKTHCFLIPNEIASKYQTMSISTSGSSKWWDYEIDTDDLNGFFRELTA